MLQYHCQKCNERLSNVEYFRSPFCEKPNCQRAKAQHYLEEKKIKILTEVTAEVSQAFEKFKQQNHTTKVKGVDLNLINVKSIESTHLSILPVNTNPLIKLTKKRKSEFLLHLETLYIDITEKRPPSTKVYAEQLNPPLTNEESVLLGKACATCMGECCSLGKEHAFQDTASLSYYLNNQSKELTLDELTQLFSQYFPIKSYKNACVFQSKTGCTLPSELRSFTCHNYRCPSLRSYHQETLNNDKEITIAAATKEKEIKKISIFNETTFIEIR